MIGDYQNHNGDFGQYYLHAQNLLEGRTWSTFIEGYPAVLPGYSIFLTVLFLLFGDSYFVIGLANVVLWSFSAVVFSCLIKETYERNWLAVLVFIGMLASSYPVIFAQDGQPNILFTFTFILSIWALRQRSINFILLTLLVLLPGFIRIDSIVLYVALFIYGFDTKRRDYVILATFGAITTMGGDVFIAHVFGMKSNITHFLATSSDGSGGAGFVGVINVYLETLIGTVFALPKILISANLGLHDAVRIDGLNGFSAELSLLGLVLVILSAIGVFSASNIYGSPKSRDGLLSLERLVFIGYLAFIALFMLPVVALRYVLPAFPFFILFLALGAERTVSYLRAPPILAKLLLTPFLCLAGWFTVTTDYDFAKRKNFMTSAHTQEMADHLASFVEDRQVGFYKARLLTVLLEKRSLARHRTWSVRNSDTAQRLLELDGVIVVRNGHVSDEFLDWLNTNTSLCPTWENPGFAIYEQRVANRQCYTSR